MLLRLQVLVGRGLPHLLALGDLIVFLVGEVFGTQDADGPVLRLRLLPLRCCQIFL